MGGSRIAFYEVEPWEEEYLRTHLSGGFELSFTPDKLDQNNLETAKNANIIVCFIYSDLSEDTLEELKNLQGIATMSVGCDHIDLTEAKKRNLIVCNVPHYGSNSVAEHAAALMLAIARNLIASIDRTRHGDFNYQGLTGVDLFGKTLGLIGTGKIGSHLARIADGLGMKILAVDERQAPDLVQKYHVEYVSLPQLLHHSDFINIQVPLTKDNVHMVSTEQFNMMKHGAVLINIARGALVDNEALLEALNSGRVAHAGIDVLEEEGLIREEKELFSPYFKLKDYQRALIDHVLMRHPNVLVTPHNAFNSKEALESILATTIENINGMVTKDLVNVVEG